MSIFKNYWIDKEDTIDLSLSDLFEIPLCPDCGESMIVMVDKNYGADRDGNRGIEVEWIECPSCGCVPPEDDD